MVWRPRPIGARRASRDAGRRRGASRASVCANRSIGSSFETQGVQSATSGKSSPHCSAPWISWIGVTRIPSSRVVPSRRQTRSPSEEARPGRVRRRQFARAARMTSSALTRTKCVAPAPRVATRRSCARAPTRPPRELPGRARLRRRPRSERPRGAQGVGRGGGRARRRRADGHLPKGRPPRRRQGLQAPGGCLRALPHRVPSQRATRGAPRVPRRARARHA